MNSTSTCFSLLASCYREKSEQDLVLLFRYDGLPHGESALNELKNVPLIAPH